MIQLYIEVRSFVKNIVFISFQEKCKRIETCKNGSWFNKVNEGVDHNDYGQNTMNITMTKYRINIQ